MKLNNIETMEKIEILLEKLDNRIPQSLAKRLDTLDDLQEKVEATGEDYEKNPTDDNRKNYNEVINYVEKMELGIIKDLEALLEKRKEEELTKKPAEAPATATATATATAPATETPEVKKEEKKEGTGMLTLVIGGALLIASFGAINYFRKQ
jgi:CO dehydrogenase/acetyl-CoA synthase beta subunit